MLSDKIYLIRHKVGFSQEKFAGKLAVSRQAVQRWENGVAYPDLDNMIKIAKMFNVSLDWLNDLSDYRSIETLRHQDSPVPSYQELEIWESYAPDVYTDYMQALDEGRDVEELHDIVKAVANYKKSAEKEDLANVIYSILYNAPMREDYHYREPDDLVTIKLLCNDDLTASDDTVLTDEQLRDKLTAAWRGRLAGCMLGQPVECIKTKELHTLLKRSGNYPMHRYITSKDVDDAFYDSFEFPLRTKTYADMLKDGFIGDDDINFTCMAASIVHQYGRNFSSKDVCNWWKGNQTMYCYATAEKIAYRNMVAGYYAPDTALYKNPFREWIGAQIRADYFGYINPGDPKMAAEMAWRDARVSHVKNGIYGEMYVAAMIAKAAVCSSVEKIVECGMSYIPATSRLYEKLEYVVKQYKDGKTYDEFFKDFHSRYDEYKPHDAVHTIPNAELVTAALLYGGGDFTKSICMAVQQGYDTDCNGATVGSIVGIMVGTDGIAKEWTDPIGDKTRVFFNHPPFTTTEMVDLMMMHIAAKNE